MALGALVGIVTVLLAKEPYKDRAYREEREKLPFKPRLRRFLRESVYEPFKDFMHHHRWGLILLFILLYRLSDEYKAPMAFVFYKDMGFSNAEIAYVSKFTACWRPLPAACSAAFISNAAVCRKR